MKYYTLTIIMFIGYTTIYSQTNVENKIDKIISFAYIEKSANSIDSLLNSDIYLTKYWQTYLKYNRSIIEIDKGEIKKAKTFFKSSTKDLLKIENAENFILAALIENTSIKLASPAVIPYKTQAIKKYLHQAKLLESTNPRIYLVEGINNFYTPKLYGGLVKTEMLMKKAIAFFDSSTFSKHNNIQWGRDLCYLFLLRYYNKINDQKKFKETLIYVNKVYAERYWMESYKK